MIKVENRKKDTLTREDFTLLFSMCCGRPLQASTIMKRTRMTDLRVFQEQLGKLVRMGLVIEQEYYGDILYRIPDHTRRLLEKIFKTAVYRCETDELLEGTVLEQYSPF